MTIDATKIVMIAIDSYDESTDTFGVIVNESEKCQLPAILLPALTREYGEPSEFIGRFFDVLLP
jgi:hypothetical protein